MHTAHLLRRETAAAPDSSSIPLSQGIFFPHSGYMDTFPRIVILKDGNSYRDVSVSRVLGSFCLSFPFSVDEGTVEAAEARLPLLNCTKCSCRERCLAGCTFFQTKNWELGELWGQVFAVPFQNRLTALPPSIAACRFPKNHSFNFTRDWLWRIITTLSVSDSAQASLGTTSTN